MDGDDRDMSWAVDLSAAIFDAVMEHVPDEHASMVRNAFRLANRKLSRDLDGLDTYGIPKLIHECAISRAEVRQQMTRDAEEASWGY
jgi:hypothetical protein